MYSVNHLTDWVSPGNEQNRTRQNEVRQCEDGRMNDESPTLYFVDRHYLP